MRWVIEVILTCGKQCLPLRAHREQTPNTNSGDFLAILRLLGKTNQTLKEHLDDPIAKNAQYLSPHIQNKIIGIIAYDILQRDLIDEVKKAKFLPSLLTRLRVTMLSNFPFVLINRMMYARSSWSLEDVLRLMVRQYPMKFCKL